MATSFFPVDLKQPQHVHIVGIGGAGMSSLATVLAANGHRVTGTDLKGSVATARLEALGVTTHVGHDAQHLSDATLITCSRAIPESNPELVAARKRQIPFVNRTQLLAEIAAPKRVLAVAGTHGKTTTSSMLSLMLVEAGIDPCFIIGGSLNELGTGAVWGKGDWLVIEADESDGTFLEVEREGGIVTNVEPDHLEQYGGWDGYRAAFVRFIRETSGPVVVCIDDATAAELAHETNAITYGFNAGFSVGAHYQIVDHEKVDRSSQVFTVRTPAGESIAVTLPVAGLHNVRNATAALVLAIETGVSSEACVNALKRFAGVHRRFTYRGEPRGITLVDDYAHLPSEVSSTLSVAVDGGWDRVVAVFQPHRYSRIAKLAPEFRDSFVGVDVLVITDIYHAHETPIPGVTGQLVVDAVAKAHPEQVIVYTPTRDDTLNYLAGNGLAGGGLQEGDLCISLGCGDITTLHDQLEPLLAGVSISDGATS